MYISITHNNKRIITGGMTKCKKGVRRGGRGSTIAKKGVIIEQLLIRELEFRNSIAWSYGNHPMDNEEQRVNSRWSAEDRQRGKQ